jgi:hypothetical protein
MFHEGLLREGSPIVYDAPAELRKWPSLGGKRREGCNEPYLISVGTIADCIRRLLAKPVKAISLYHIVTAPQLAFNRSILTAGDAAEIALRRDFPADPAADNRAPIGTGAPGDPGATALGLAVTAIAAPLAPPAPEPAASKRPAWPAARSSAAASAFHLAQSAHRRSPPPAPRMQQ